MIPQESEALPLRFTKLFDELEMRVMDDFVRRISEMQDISGASDYQMNRLYELGSSKASIKKAAETALNATNAEVDTILEKIAKSGYNESTGLYEAVSAEFIAYEDNQELQQLVSAIKEQTQNECKNITQTIGFALRQPNGKLGYRSTDDYFKSTMDKASMDVLTGEFDYNSVLKKAVKEMTDSGLRQIDYESGHCDRVDVAARRALLTGINQVTAKVNEHNAAKLGTEYFEVSRHNGARPSHQTWQGRVYSKDELVTVCGLGDVAGLCGANCRHSYFPFIPGVSVRTYTDEQLDEMNAAENEKKSYNGREYTMYEATQAQRKYERKMRAQRQEIKLLESGGADEEDIIAAKARYRRTQDEYVKFSEAMGLPQQWERVTTDGYYNIGNITKSEEKLLNNAAESDILKERSAKEITKITDAAINKVPYVKIEGYSDEQCAEIQQQHKELLRYARDNNDSKEVAFVFDSSLESKYTIKGDESRIEFGYIGARDALVMHNHPRNSSFSMTDIESFVADDTIKILTIVKNNGGVETLIKGQGFDKYAFFVEYKRLYKKIVKTGIKSEKDKVVRKLLTQSKSGVIWDEF